MRGKSQRQVARELGISRNTVARYIKGDLEPGVTKSSDPRPSPARDEVAPHVEELLEKSRTTRKQKLTAPRVVELLEENGIQASERTVRRVMREWRRLRAEVSVPLEYRPGDLAEANFFEVVVVVDGLEQKAWMLVVRMMHSGRDFARVYQWQDQPCFLDGHVRAFAHLGCVPERLLYDNLKAAVQRVLVGSERELNARFAGLAEPPRPATPLSAGSFLPGAATSGDAGSRSIPARVTMSWRTSAFPESAPDSHVGVELSDAPGGTGVHIDHTEIPDGQGDDYLQGWIEHYLDPMRRHWG